jgi:N-acetylglucosaminyl-diphospho-decaprenol L-rhamnosyltransferase
MIRKNFTFVITTFRSGAVIDECLKDMPKDIRKIIVENSNDHNLKDRLENMYENTECFLMSDNLGYGKANNFGIIKSNTDYVFILNPDTKITDEKFTKIVSLLQEQDFAIAAPQIVEKNIVYKQNKSDHQIKKVEHVFGMAMILNKRKFGNNFFDENIFLYHEEIDLCKRMINIGQNILELNIQLNHLGNQSHGGYDFEMEKSRNWHWMWSKFYFYKKHHNYFYSFFKTLPNFLSSIFKFLIYKLLTNRKKSSQYKMRFLGLLNSYMLCNSHYRPYNKKD